VLRILLPLQKKVGFITKPTFFYAFWDTRRHTIWMAPILMDTITGWSY